MYGLKSAPRVWYERLRKFLINPEYLRGKVNTNLSIKHHGNHNLLVQVYVDDIIFGYTNMQLVKEFYKLMQGIFEMSLMGEINFFVGL